MRQIPPFLKILPLVVLGIALGSSVEIRAWMVAVGAMLCSLLGYILRKRRVAELYIALSVLLWALFATEVREPQERRSTTPSIEEFDATITTIPYTAGRWHRCDAEVVGQFGTEKILLRADTSLTISLAQCGTLYGKIRPLPEGSYGELMRRRGYAGTLYLTSPHDWQVQGVAHSPTIGARRLQHRLLSRLDTLGLNRDDSAIVKAMLLGWRGEIDAPLRDSYSRAGASHLLAISGLHVGIVAMLVWWLCWLLPLAGRRGHIVRNIVAALIMLLYAIVTGLSPSVVRATLMFCVAQLSLAYGTTRSSLNALSGTLAMMLLVNPNNLYDISFTLSAVAVIGIATGYKPAMEFFGGESARGIVRTLLGVIIVGVCSTLATLPLVAHTFGIVSLVGIFLNPVVILTAEIIVLTGIIWVSLPIGALAPVMGWIIEGAAKVQNSIVEYAASLPVAAVQTTLPEWIVVVCYVAMGVMVVWASRSSKKERWRVES